MIDVRKTIVSKILFIILLGHICAIERRRVNIRTSNLLTLGELKMNLSWHTLLFSIYASPVLICSLYNWWEMKNKASLVHISYHCGISFIDCSFFFLSHKYLMCNCFGLWHQLFYYMKIAFDLGFSLCEIQIFWESNMLVKFKLCFIY